MESSFGQTSSRAVSGDRSLNEDFYPFIPTPPPVVARFSLAGTLILSIFPTPFAPLKTRRQTLILPPQLLKLPLAAA